jgi:hypothetical protein
LSLVYALNVPSGGLSQDHQPRPLGAVTPPSRERHGLADRFSDTLPLNSGTTVSRAWPVSWHIRAGDQIVGRSAYGNIKETQLMNCLPVDELEELETLMARRRRSAASEARLSELWDKAFDLHAETDAGPEAGVRRDGAGDQPP